MPENFMVRMRQTEIQRSSQEADVKPTLPSVADVLHQCPARHV
jgi:hypothetical protein